MTSPGQLRRATVIMAGGRGARQVAHRSGITVSRVAAPQLAHYIRNICLWPLSPVVRDGY
jgi:hypothetical protein